jgi:transcriptional regulator with GAF, ATPase, and Fis domain
MAVYWRKTILIFAGVLACVYALSVLWYVHSIPDIGLRSAFDRDVKRFDGPCFAVLGGPTDALQEGDRIKALGGKAVETWPNLLRALRELPNREPKPVANLQEAEGATYIRLTSTQPVRRAGDAALGASASDDSLILQDERLVRLEFERPGAKPGEIVTLSCWCRVGHLPFLELLPSILWFFLKFGLFIVGALVFWKRPTDVSATQFFLLCIVTLGAYMGGYHWARIATSPPLLLVFMVCGVLLPAVLLHFYCVFPRPKEYLRQHPRRTLLAIYGLPLAFLTALVMTYFCVWWLNWRGDLEEEVNLFLGVLLVEIYVYLGVAALWYLASVLCLVHSYRTAADPTERNQAKVIMFGSLAALLLIGWTLGLAIFRRNAFSAGAGTVPMFLVSACFTVAFVISITRYRLMQLDQLISSGMVYFVFSFLAGVVYYAVVFVGTLLVGSRTGPTLEAVLPVSTTALVLILLLDIVRSRIKKVLDRRFYREKYKLDRTLRRMGKAIEQLVDPPTLAKQLLQTSVEVLGVSCGAGYLRQGDPPLYCLADATGVAPSLQELSAGCPLIEALSARGAVVAQNGRAALADPCQRQLRLLGGEVAQALFHERELLALLVLGPKDLGTYGTEDLNLVAAFAQLTALALQSADRHRTIEELNRDLQAKVEKISEQQRHILALRSQLMRQSAPATTSPPAAEPAPRGMIGSSPLVQRLWQRVKKVAASPSAVLIRGESGTGKELLAQALHERSPRAGKAFVKVHCAALSATLLESELFGHVKGAFTTAIRDKVGRFELANGGTLFLDEIGDISLEVQTKLLRVLQEMVFERVGSSEPVKVDVRVIAATHQDLEGLIREGRFREDLYYRLNVISLTMPPLRERVEDIPELAQHFLSQQAQRSGKAVTELDDEALALLKGYDWPGNIRQLEHAVAHAVVMAEGPAITIEDLPAELLDAGAREEEAPLTDVLAGPKSASESPGLRGERETRGRRERERLVRALAAAKGNKAEAARALGLARSTLLSRLKKYGLS